MDGKGKAGDESELRNSGKDNGEEKLRKARKEKKGKQQPRSSTTNHPNVTNGEGQVINLNSRTHERAKRGKFKQSFLTGFYRIGKGGQSAPDFADGQMGGKGVPRHAKTPRGGLRSEVGYPRADGTVPLRGFFCSARPSGRTYRKTRRPVGPVRSVAALVERGFSVCFTPDPGQDGACPSRNLIRKIRVICS